MELRNNSDYKIQTNKKISWIINNFKYKSNIDISKLIIYFDNLKSIEYNNYTFHENASYMLMNLKNYEDLILLYDNIEEINSSNCSCSRIFKIIKNEKCIMIHKYPNDILSFDESYKDEFLHEAFIGFVLNKLRCYIPNFVYTYAYYKTQEENYNPYIIVIENIENAINLEDIIQNLDNIEYFTILIQILNAFNLAYDFFKFTHNDLHDGNILIQKFEENITIPIYINNNITYIKTKYLAKIIDFGQSYIRLDNQNYGIHHMENNFIYSFKSNPFKDIYKLLCFNAYKAMKENNKQVFNLINKIYLLFDQKKSLIQRFKIFEDNLISIYDDNNNEIKKEARDSFNYNKSFFQKKKLKNNLVKEYRHIELIEILINQFDEWKYIIV